MIHLLLFLLVDVGIVKGGSLSDIKHVVLFMQENRAFDHV
jgi:phospholipase C